LKGIEGIVVGASDELSSTSAKPRRIESKGKLTVPIAITPPHEMLFFSYLQRLLGRREQMS